MTPAVKIRLAGDGGGRLWAARRFGDDLDSRLHVHLA